MFYVLIHRHHLQCIVSSYKEKQKKNRQDGIEIYFKFNDIDKLDIHKKNKQIIKIKL